MFFVLHVLFLSSSSDTEVSPFILVVPFVLGGIFYRFYYMRYTNRDKRHLIEYDTTVHMSNLVRDDVFVSSFNRVQNKYMTGSNHTDYRRTYPLPGNGTVYSWPSPALPDTDPNFSKGGLPGSPDQSPSE